MLSTQLLKDVVLLFVCYAPYLSGPAVALSMLGTNLVL